MIPVVWWRAIVLATLSAIAFSCAQVRADDAPNSASWGVYAELAGTTRIGTNGGYYINWKWIVPGKSLLEEWQNPGTEKLSHTNTITLGNEPGRLLVNSTIFGGKNYEAIVMPDGSVVFVGNGLLGMSSVFRLAPDGALELVGAKFREGRIVSTWKPSKYARYFPAPESAVPAASEPRQVAATQGAGVANTSASNVAANVKSVNTSSSVLSASSNIQSVLDSKDQSDFDGGYYDEYEITGLIGKKLYVDIIAAGFEPIVIMGKRALDRSLSVQKIRVGNVPNKPGRIVMSIAGPGFDTLRVAALDGGRGSYSISVRSGPLPPVSADARFLGPELLAELKITHERMKRFVDERGMKTVIAGKGNESRKKASVFGYHGHECIGIFQTDGGQLKLDWADVKEVRYGASAGGDPIVVVLSRRQSAPDFTFALASEPVSRETAQMMNLTRASCLPLDLN